MLAAKLVVDGDDVPAGVAGHNADLDFAKEAAEEASLVTRLFLDGSARAQRTHGDDDERLTVLGDDGGGAFNGDPRFIGAAGAEFEEGTYFFLAEERGEGPRHAWKILGVGKSEGGCADDIGRWDAGDQLHGRVGVGYGPGAVEHDDSIVEALDGEGSEAVRQVSCLHSVMFDSVGMKLNLRKLLAHRRRQGIRTEARARATRQAPMLHLPASLPGQSSRSFWVSSPCSGGTSCRWPRSEVLDPTVRQDTPEQCRACPLLAERAAGQGAATGVGVCIFRAG